MANPVVKLGHFVLKNQLAYDTYQDLVGGVNYRARIVDRLVNQEPPVFLDLGCGTATIASRLSSETKYIGVDNSENYLLKAQKSYPQHRFHNLDLGERNWDIQLPATEKVIASGLGILHHLDGNQVRTFLENCRKVLGSNSTLFTVDPVIVESSTIIARWFANNDRGKYIRTPRMLEDLFKKNGYEVSIEVKSKQFRIPLDTVEITAKPN